jgi:hypothetical protein
MYEVLSFDFEIKHLPGIENHLPDVLSRFYDDDPRREERPDYVSLLGALPATEATEQTIQELWTNNTPVATGVQGVVEDSTLEGTAYTESLGPEDLSVIEDGELQRVYIQRAHSNGHIHGQADQIIAESDLAGHVSTMSETCSRMFTMSAV